MKKALKILMYILVVLLVGIGGLLAYVKIALPNVGEAPVLTIEVTPERVERGKYLAYNVAVCIDCHSTRDWSKFSGPIVAGTEGEGGEIFDQTMGFPGKFISKNITPFSLGDWTDGEVFRAITSGVSKDGSALFPVMPHPNYGKMAKEDIYSIIAYLRTLEPIESHPEQSEPDFPMNFILNTIPKKPEFSSIPPKTELVNYGRYVINAASCSECHTNQIKGKIVGEPFAGGFEFLFPDGSIVRSPNITPHQTGIGNWSKEQFVNRFKMYADSSYVPHSVATGEFQTVMPWMLYAQMETNDLEAIYHYLQSIQPVDQVNVVFSPSEN